jgi:hypothetical protein
MLAFIDESGDCGLKFGKGSSSHFTCVVVMFNDNSCADACDRAVDALRVTLQRPHNYEFHFATCSDNVRHAFLEAVSREGFNYAGFAIDKRRLAGCPFQDPMQLYEFAVGMLCEQVKPLLDDAKIVIDKNGSHEFRRNLEKALKTRMTEVNGKCRIRKVTMETSHSNNLCGAVSRSLTANDGRFRNLIKQREKFVNEWPAKIKSRQPILIQERRP